MAKSDKLDSIYDISDNIVAREIQGEFIIIPVTSGVGDLEEAIFTLNETGKAIWDSLDGKMTLKDVVKKISSDFDGSSSQIEKDVLGLIDELFKRGMIVKRQ